jgi:hypothetical protein
MSHGTYTQGNQGDFQLLVVGSQIANLTPSLSFGHNLCFRCPNGSCEPILDIYVSIAFQWYEKLLEPLGFGRCNHSLNIRESTRTPTPNMGALGSVRVLSLTLFSTLGGMKMRLSSLVLARTLASPLPWSQALYLGHKPKARVVIKKIIQKFLCIKKIILGKKCYGPTTNKWRITRQDKLY